jgi:hypothetical protein
MTTPPISYVAAIPDQISTAYLGEMIAYLEKFTPGFKGVDAADTHLTVAGTREPGGFEASLLLATKAVAGDGFPIETPSQGHKFKLLYSTSCHELMVGWVMDSPEFERVREVLTPHENHGFKRVPHITLGILDPEAIGISAEEMEGIRSKAKERIWGEIQARLDGALGEFMQSEAGLAFHRMEKELDLTLGVSHLHGEPFNGAARSVVAVEVPIQRRANPLEQVRQKPLEVEIGIIPSEHWKNGPVQPQTDDAASRFTAGLRQTEGYSASVRYEGSAPAVNQR